MQRDSSPRISRRRLLQAATVAAGAGAVPLSTAAGSQTQWDREVDVVVIGAGTGLAAALVAAVAGLKVLVLEKHVAPGGNAAVSGGVLWVPNNRVMLREGLKDDREQALVYLRHVAQGQADENLLTAVVDRGPDMLDYLEQHTALRWRVSRIMGEAADYHPTWRGGMTFGRSVEPVQPTVAMAGGLLISELLMAVQKHGGELLTATPARRLLSETTAEGTVVTGVEAEQGGKPLRIRARRGVLVAAGGFERNAEMKRHFLRGPSPYTLGAETNTGDGIRMGMALGADLRNMNEAWGITAYQAEAEAFGGGRGGISLSAQIERRNPASLCVNRYGRRFCNEAADYDSSWRTFHTWENWGENGYHNIPAFQIFDHSCREHRTIAGRTKDQSLPDWVAVADSLEALAEKLGIDAAGLAATVAEFNRHAATGRDPHFHRGESPYDSNGSGKAADALQPLTRTPFYGAQVTPADLGTCGGLRIDERARVIDVFGQPIRGLYACGNSAGVGGPGALYGGGGGTLGPAFTFAYIAGHELTTQG